MAKGQTAVHMGKAGRAKPDLWIKRPNSDALRGAFHGGRKLLAQECRRFHVEVCQTIYGSGSVVKLF